MTSGHGIGVGRLKLCEKWIREKKINVYAFLCTFAK